MYIHLLFPDRSRSVFTELVVPVVSRASLLNKGPRTTWDWFEKKVLTCLGVCIYKISIVIRILWTIPKLSKLISSLQSKDLWPRDPRNHDFIASTAEGRLIRLLVRSQRHRSESSYRVNWKIFASMKKRGFFLGGMSTLTFIFCCWTEYSN